MARLRTSAEIIALAMKVRSEGMGLRATGRVLGKSGGSIINWEERLSNQLEKWSPQAPVVSEVTIEGDEVYTRVGENLPPQRRRAGQFTSSSVTVDIGSQRKQVSKMQHYSTRESQPLGSGLNPVPRCAGLQTVSGVIAKRSGKKPVSI